MMNPLSLIEAKRDGGVFSDRDIQVLVREYSAGRIPDYQMAALLMAIYFRGLNGEETRALTLAMRDSGERLSFPNDPRPVVDKHSTGGVGDKVSIVLAPLLAALGFRVPMISGRGLGITGGTLDKLESIPGMSVTLTREQIIEQVQRVGCVICAATADMVPADKEMYALRDVTGTISSIPLITASILSKKLAEGISSLVLDVKFGAGAFMKTAEEARTLAKTMVELGTACGVKTCALITQMDSPLGRAAGNWLEVKECVECLGGGGPHDLRGLAVETAARLLVMENIATLEEAREKAAASLAAGCAHEKFIEMLKAQGADLKAFAQKVAAAAPGAMDVKAKRAGYITGCDARIVGKVVQDLGGGRMQKDSKIDLEVGVDRIRRTGELVKTGDMLCRVHAVEEGQGYEACLRVAEAFRISDEPVEVPPLIHDVIGPD